MPKVTEVNENINPEEVIALEVTPDAVATPVESVEAAHLEEKVISVARVSRTSKGGRRIRFRALVAVGDRQGNIGLGVGKASEVVIAVNKAVHNAKKNMFTIPIVRHTIPHEIQSKFDTAKVLLKPAPVGTSIIAGGAVRPILELAGVENVVGKCLTRTTNKYNNAYATLAALKALKDIKEVAPRYYVKRHKRPRTETADSKTSAKKVAAKTAGDK